MQTYGRAQRITVVVVDDDPDYLWLVRAILRMRGDEVNVVGEAASGEAALRVIQHQRPDVVIVDLVMPSLNGLELTKRIKNEWPQTKVLLMSAYTEETYRRISSVSGADGFINKRLLHSRLLPAVRELIVQTPEA